MYSLLLNFLDPDQATLILLMLLSIPISCTLSQLTNKWLILALSITSSLIFHCIMFPDEKYILWVQQQVVYLLLRFGPRSSIGKIVIIESFGFLAVVQFRRMYISYAVNGVDITGILMMQTFNYVGLAYNYQNGLKADQSLTQSAIKRKVVKLPDYATYMGYMLFVPASLVGPVFQFRDFQDYINRKGDYQKIPNTIKAAGKQLGIFLASLAIYVGTMRYNLWYIVKPQFADQSYLYKMSYICATIFNMQFKYITAWSLGMIGVHASGISYSKATNTFDKIQVTKIFGFFFDPSLKIKIQCWNMSAQIALKRYIYQQIYDQKKVYQSQKHKKKVQAIAQRNTLLASALWHGFYPGYFLSFMHWMVYLRMSQQLYRLRKLQPKVDRLWTQYKFGIIENIISNFVFLYFGAFLHIMTWENIKAVLYATYGIPFFILYASYFIIYQAEMFSKNKSKKVSKSGSETSEGLSPIFEDKKQKQAKIQNLVDSSQKQVIKINKSQ